MNEKTTQFKREINNNCVRIIEHKRAKYISFIPLEKYDLIQGFSTKEGGVSVGEYATMNLSSNRGDDPDAVKTNHKLLAEAIGYDVEDLVLTRQVHSTNIKIVGKKDTGEVFFDDRTIKDIDGIITNESGVVLMTFFADCVPLVFYDYEKKVIANAHSGWRGTANLMGKRVVEKMQEVYGSNPESIIGIIGPSICRDCYEVTLDLYEEFQNNFSEDELEKIFVYKDGNEYRKTDAKDIRKKTHDELKNMHAQLDLWKANEIILKKSGLKNENIYCSEVCTCCNHDLLFSHRYTKGRRGNLVAVIGLKK